MQLQAWLHSMWLHVTENKSRHSHVYIYICTKIWHIKDIYKQSFIYWTKWHNPFCCVLPQGVYILTLKKDSQINFQSFYKSAHQQRCTLIPPIVNIEFHIAPLTPQYPEQWSPCAAQVFERVKDGVRCHLGLIHSRTVWRWLAHRFRRSHIPEHYSAV